MTGSGEGPSSLLLSSARCCSGSEERYGCSFLGHIIDGLTGGNISTLFAYVADITEPAERGRIYGLLGAAGGFGFIMGPVIGGLAGHFLLSAPVFIAALLTMANLLCAYLALPESLPSDKRATTFRWNHLNPFAPFVHVFQTTTLRIAFVSEFLFYFAGTMLQGNISVFLKDILRFGPSGIGLLLLIVGIMDITSQGYLTGKLLPRFGEASLSRVGLAINAVGLVMVAAICLFSIVDLSLYRRGGLHSWGWPLPTIDQQLDRECRAPRHARTCTRS